MAFESLGWFSLQSKFRQRVIWLTEWKGFDAIIMILIVLNSTFLGFYDYQNPDFWGNKLVDNSEIFFTISFALEALLKIIASGFILERGCYLRDAWNWLDFIVVITAVLA